MKHYVIERTTDGVQVDVIDGTSPTGGYALPPRPELAKHLVSNFDFGRAAPGSAMLALALIADAIDDETALKHYQAFKARVIAPQECDAFELSQEDIKQIVAGLERQKGWAR
ncbi:MAG TPA: DUF6166 domain-containing protein [Gemmataceae bacterium]|nr:DUF6166 domain-containing protein [Gemmataceae bacterium]